MKKLIYIFLFLGFYQGFSQEFKTISFSELDFEVNNDTTQIKAKKADKYLNGKYKLILNPDKDEYSLCEFEDGKVVGLQKGYRNGKLTGTTEFENGMKNGFDIVYDQTAEEMMWKIHYVNGKKHGLTWWSDVGNEYFINDEKATQAEYEEYEKIKNRE
ncbi:hypothetical protein QSV08_07685 [Maribacter sp. BPC-D8]|uniref:hypothetical protein n=1 Tax=Maribacter sp. BPC-D8 TaxID=3053613 RepID=UPI002B4918A3|nr:hypothetical protein [Maribacter sp. BPC-D8]WRI31125.1 hypothetical protein QSV08_07685 [Maribacter sp. BPC-D8]